MTIIVSAGLSQHVEHPFDDDDEDEDDSNSGRHLRHHRQYEEDEDELSEASKRASGNLSENSGGQMPAGGAISAPKVDGGANFSTATGDFGLFLATGLASFVAGALTAPGNRDRIVAFINIKIAVAFLIICGFVIMEQCRARKCRDGLDVMATHERQISHEKDGTSVSKEKNLEEYRRGRERVLQALGSIHEFPLEANDRIAVCDRHINASVVQSINECANFSEASSELIQTIDKCLEVLRIGTGLHIGIGPASKSVCRVENTIVGREYRKAQIHENSQTSKHFSPQKFSAPLGLGRAREILYYVMAEHFELLDSLLASPCDGDVEDGEICLHRSTTMSPLTLSSLVTWRKALGKLQSQLLAELCAAKGPDKDNLKAATVTVRERNLYLQSCFPVSSTSSTEENGSAQHVQQRHLDNIYQRIDAALVSIWAFENSEPLPNDLDSEQQSHGESQCTKKEWWLRTRDMLLEAIAYWHELDLHLASTGTIKYEDEEDFCLNQDDKAQGTQEYQWSKNTGTFESAAEQISSKKNSNAIALHPADKTIVFSGRANRRRLRDEKSDKHDQESNAPSSSSCRNNLFTELQSRIDMIELADEWDAHQERENGSDTEGDDDDGSQGANNEDDKIRTSTRRAMPLVLGGVALLEELKESTVAVAESENEVVLGE